MQPEPRDDEPAVASDATPEVVRTEPLDGPDADIEGDVADGPSLEPHDGAPPEGPFDDEGADGQDDDVAVATGAAGPAPIAEFHDVTKKYGEHHALGPLDLTLARGTIGLLGPNGAGKSTAIRLMMGLLKPTTGSLRVLGAEVEPGSLHLRKRIGYAPEGEAQFPDLTGVEAVAYAGRLVGMSKTDALQRTHQVLDYVGLDEARYRLVTTYSTGMRQRLKLAQALVHDPELLILDEPTEGVDPEARDQLLDLIGELVREHDIQVLLSTHLLHDVESLASHALVLHQGNEVAHGPVTELKTAGAKGYLVRVAGSADPLLARLSEHDIIHERLVPNIRVELDDPREVIRHVREAGLVVRHLAPAELTLNEAFEQAVGGAPDA